MIVYNIYEDGEYLFSLESKDLITEEKLIEKFENYFEGDPGLSDKLFSYDIEKYYGFVIGSKVLYSYVHQAYGIFQNGIIAEISNEGFRVVFNCNEDWENYEKHESQFIKISDSSLKQGWGKEKDQTILTEKHFQRKL